MNPKRRRPSYAAIASTLALVVSIMALCLGGALAAKVFVTSKQIRNGTIRTQDIHKAAVKSSDIGKEAVASADIKTGAVLSADIGTGQVTPQDVDLPEPEQIQASTASAKVGTGFALVGSLGSYTKEDPASDLRVNWTGTASGEANCVFELRVGGKSSGNGTGQLFVAGGAPLSVSVTTLFPGLGAGPQAIEVWARITDTTGTADGTAGCTVGPAAAGIAQTVVVDEIVS